MSDVMISDLLKQIRDPTSSNQRFYRLYHLSQIACIFVALPDNYP
jgi:hypothetical protein